MVLKSQNPFLKIDSLVIPLPINQYVEKNLTFLMQITPKFTRSCLANSSKWLPMINRIAKEEGMPAEIAFLAMVESGLKPTAVSKSNAVGMWQFIRGTADMYNFRMDEWMDERRDPEKATRGGLRHLKDLYTKFGDWHLAMAAYNCGAGGVKRAIQKSGLENPTFWDIRPYLPKETKDYVPLYIAMALINLQPEYYGFNLKELNYQEEYAYEKFELKEPVSIKALSECANVDMKDLLAINPELLQNTTPPDSTYTLKLPVSTKNLFAARFATLTPEQKQPWLNYVVQKKESLSEIAQRYKMSTEDLATANNLSSKYRPRKGETIRVPLDLMNKTVTQPENITEKADSKPPFLNSDNSSETKTTKADNSKKYISHIVIRRRNSLQYCSKIWR